MIVKNILVTLFITFISLNTYAQRILRDDYYMVSVNDTKMFRQSNDTLYLYKCSPDYVQLPKLKASDHYKILDVKTTSVYTIVKLEKLDSISLTTDPYPSKRYYISVFKNINDKTAAYLMLYRGLAKNELNSIRIPDLNSKFFITLITESYKKELFKLKPFSKDDANIIVKELQSTKYKELVERYKATDLNDMYATYLSAELLYRACKDNGYNPINAGAKISALLKQK